MRPISVLFTNNSLDQRGGTETYVRDVALALLRRGHRPAAFSLVHGGVSAELRRATVPVVDDVTRLGERPDVIHGHHHVETLIAALAFPDVPIVHFCHGWVPWEEMPLHHPSIRRYVAVDEVCVDRLVREEGVSLSQIDVLLNFVDVERFRPRPPLPVRPGRALILSNAAGDEAYARTIRAACEASGIVLDIVGAASRNATSSPESLLGAYDLVFGKGRTALEALAVGCATIIADVAGAGPMVTPENFSSLRSRNFGIRTLSQPHDVAWYVGQIARYSATEVPAVSARVRTEAALEPAVSRLIEIYSNAMALPPGPGDPSRAAAIHCSRMVIPLKEAFSYRGQCQSLTSALMQAHTDIAAHTADHQAQFALTSSLEARLETVRAGALAREQQAVAVAEAREAESRILQERIHALTIESAAHMRQMASLEEQAAESGCLRVEVSTLTADVARAMGEYRAVEGQLAHTQAQVRVLERQLAAYESLPTLRLRDAVLKTPVLGVFLQSVARRLARHLTPASDRPQRSPAEA